MIKVSSTRAGRIGAPPLVPAAPAIDFAHLARMTLGEQGLECEVLRLFDRQAAMLLARMSGATPAKIAACAHTLKGSALGIGAWQVADAAEAVELAAGAGDQTSLEHALAQLAAAVEATRAVIGDRLRATEAVQQSR